MTYADRCYVGKRVKFGLLDDADVRQIHEATLDVIETVGVKFHSHAALDILEEHGATVDRHSTVARIPAAVVEQALSTVPEKFVLGARNPEYDLPLDGEHIYISSDGCGVFARDFDGQRALLAQAGPAGLRARRAGPGQRERHQRRGERAGLPTGNARAARVRCLHALL